MPCGSNACLTRFISAISSARQLERQEPRLGEADAVLAADRPLQRDDAFEQHALRLVRALDLVRRRCGSTMMLTWMLPSPAWPKHGMRSRNCAFEPIDEREQLRDPALRHDDVVVELERRDHLAATATARGGRARAPARSASSRARRTSVAPASRHARSTRVASSATAAGQAVDFEQQERAGPFGRQRSDVRGCARPPRANRRRSARAPPARPARG